MLVKDAIRSLLDFPMDAVLEANVYEDGPKDEEGEPPVTYHSLVNFAPKPGNEHTKVIVYTYPKRWK